MKNFWEKCYYLLQRGVKVFYELAALQYRALPRDFC